ncbi:MAG: hypothetical protein ACTHU0_38835 [Kofleriaceae bacterium]
MFEVVIVVVLMVGVLGFAVALVVGNAVGKAELDRLLASGVRVPGKLVSVDAGVPAGRSNHTRYFRVGIELELERAGGRERVTSQIVVPETLRQLVQAGAPCVVVVDTTDRTKLCLVSIDNAFGASTPVTLGSMYSRW